MAARRYSERLQSPKTSALFPRLYLSNFRLPRERCEEKQELCTGYGILHVTSEGLRLLFVKKYQEGNTIGRANSHKIFPTGEAHVMTGFRLPNNG